MLFNLSKGDKGEPSSSSTPSTETLKPLPKTLTKKEVHKLAKTSPAAKCALQHWNALNSHIRREVIKNKVMKTS